MKKYMLITVTLLLAITIITASITLPDHDANMDLSGSANTKANELGINNPEKSACIDIGNGECEFKMWKDTTTNETIDTFDENGTINGSEVIQSINRFNLGTHKISFLNCSEALNGSCVEHIEAEIGVLVKEEAEAWMEKYIEIVTKRENVSVGDEKVGRGQFTTRER